MYVWTLNISDEPVHRPTGFKTARFDEPVTDPIPALATYTQP